MTVKQCSASYIGSLNNYIKSDENSTDIHHETIGDLFTTQVRENIYLYIIPEFIRDNKLDVDKLKKIGFELDVWTMSYKLRLK